MLLPTVKRERVFVGDSELSAYRPVKTRKVLVGEKKDVLPYAKKEVEEWWRWIWKRIDNVEYIRDRVLEVLKPIRGRLYPKDDVIVYEVDGERIVLTPMFGFGTETEAKSAAVGGFIKSAPLNVMGKYVFWDFKKFRDGKERTLRDAEIIAVHSAIVGGIFSTMRLEGFRCRWLPGITYCRRRDGAGVVYRLYDLIRK